METQINIREYTLCKNDMLRELKKSKKVFGTVKMNEEFGRYVQIIKSDFIQRVLCDYDDTHYVVNLKTFERKGEKKIQYIYID